MITCLMVKAGQDLGEDSDDEPEDKGEYVLENNLQTQNVAREWAIDV